MSVTNFPAPPATTQDRVREAFAAMLKPNDEKIKRERVIFRAKHLARMLPPLLRSIRVLATDDNQRELIDLALGELRHFKPRAKAR